ncbi:hypothetical protein CGMCC3_g989 [Colletotrichum fructicola]|nr:uncharacterized protein CGMCC3_g989 [Colletotrichum fructicola]KAE9582934.1 hypothetical protein CGMCC3_g989 [Colletotrichum fructicola]
MENRQWLKLSACTLCNLREYRTGLQRPSSLVQLSKSSEAIGDAAIKISGPSIFAETSRWSGLVSWPKLCV